MAEGRAVFYIPSFHLSHCSRVPSVLPFPLPLSGESCLDPGHAAGAGAEHTNQRERSGEAGPTGSGQCVLVARTKPLVSGPRRGPQMASRVRRAIRAQPVLPGEWRGGPGGSVSGCWSQARRGQSTSSHSSLPYEMPGTSREPQRPSPGVSRKRWVYGHGSAACGAL